MFETYRMLGHEHEADLEREAARLRRADPFRRQRRRVARAAFAALAIALWWRPSIRIRGVASSARARAIAVAWRVAAVFAAGASPLLWQAARLVARSEYVTPNYGWRSIPHGVDLLAPLAGHPLHPLFQAASSRAYAAMGQNYVEAIGWMGLWSTPDARRHHPDFPATAP